MKPTILLHLTLLLHCLGCSGRPATPTPQRSTPSAHPQAPAPSEAWRKIQPSAAERAPLVYPPAETSRLANGLSIYLVPRPGGIVSLSLVALGTAAAAPAKKSGLGSFTTRLMTEGTRTRSGLQLAEAAESLGSSLEYGGNRDFVRLSLSALREDLPAALELLADVARNPRFDAGDIARVRSEWLDAIEAERQDPGTLASRVGMQALLGPLWGAPINGTRKNVEALRRSDLLAFHRAVFVPENIALIVTGEVTLESVIAEAGRLFAKWPSRRPPPQPAFEPPAQPAAVRILSVDRPGAVQSAIFLAHPLPNRAAPDHEARQVWNNAVGGLFTSRLNQNLREAHGYTYGARSHAVATRHWGAFVVTTAVRTEVTVDALNELLRELQRARNIPLSDEEIARAKADLIQSAGAHLEHTSDVNRHAQELFVQTLPSDYYARYGTTVGALSLAAINAQAELVNPDRALVVIIGDQARFGAELKREGWSVETPTGPLME